MKKFGTCKISTKRFLCLILSLALIIVGGPAEAIAAGVVPENEATGAESEAYEAAVEDDVIDTAVAEGEDGEEATEQPSEQPSEQPKDDTTTKGDIEINQCFSNHTGLNDGKEVPINQYVAKKKTLVMMKIPGSDSFTEDQAKSAIANYKMEAKALVNGNESSNPELQASADGLSVQQLFDVNCEKEKGWYAVASFTTGPDAGTYKFHFYNGDKEISNERTATFYDTKKLNILIVPVKAYYSATYDGAAPSVGAFSCKQGQFIDAKDNKQNWDKLKDAVKDYLLDVYPVVDVNVEEGAEIDCSDPKYDMVAEGDGQRLVWEEVCKRQSKKKDGTDRYDLILAFVQYRQDKGTGQGYTFGKPANIITYSDEDMLPTVAHEIAHCYQVGDEYNGGSYNQDVNKAPNNYSGRNFVTGADMKTEGANEYWQDPAGFKNTASGALKDKINTNGAGTVVKLSLHPYSFTNEKFITWGGTDKDGKATGSEVWPTISYMGSGNTDSSNKKGTDGYNWTSSVIWDHLLKQFTTKTNKAASGSAEQSSTASVASAEEAVTNAAVFANAEASGAGATENDPINDEEELYYEGRWGESRMVEVSGMFEKTSGALKVTMKPMFSYDGDLEIIEDLDETYKDSGDIYTFAAIGEDGKVLGSKSKSEEKYFAACEFNGSFYNPSYNGGKMLDKVNFSIDAEYPEGTKDFVIFKGRMSDITESGEYPKSVVWTASDAIKAGEFKGDFVNKLDKADVTYADVNSAQAEVEWEIGEYAGNKDDLYTEVYYCPEGDDGQAVYIGSSNDKDFIQKDGETEYVSFDPTEYTDINWTKNAYVWTKITNGINAVDLYSDSLEVTLAYSDIVLSGAGIKAATEDKKKVYSAEYTGKAIEPAVTVKAVDPDTGKATISLKKDVDYTVSYENNVNVGTATVTVQGIGLYGGKNSQDFEIIPCSLAKAVPGAIPDMAYSADLDNNVAKYISMTDAKGNKLSLYDEKKQQGDFTVKFKVGGAEDTKLSNLIKGEPEGRTAVTVTYSGKGNCEGECKTKVTFEVVPASEDNNLANAVITLKKDSMPYTGKAIKPAIKEVKLGDTKLKSSDYKVVYSDNVGVGTGRVTIVGKKNYTGSKSKDFTVTEKEVTSLTVTGLSNQAWTGSKIDVNKLPITVKAGGITLVKNRDYTVEEIDGANYINVTAKNDKKPGIVVKLKTKTSNMKSSECPVVKWSGKVKDEKKKVEKTFTITAAKLNSAAITFTTSGNSAEKNPVLDAEGGRQIGTIKAAPKSEWKKYTHEIVGYEEELVKDAYLEEGAYLIGPDGKKIERVTKIDGGKDIENYTVTVSKTKNGKIGSITYKAKAGSPYTGSRTIKFLYTYQPRNEDFEEDDQ